MRCTHMKMISRWITWFASCYYLQRYFILCIRLDLGIPRSHTHTPIEFFVWNIFGLHFFYAIHEFLHRTLNVTNQWRLCEFFFLAPIRVIAYRAFVFCSVYHASEHRSSNSHFTSDYWIFDFVQNFPNRNHWMCATVEEKKISITKMLNLKHKINCILMRLSNCVSIGAQVTKSMATKTEWHKMGFGCIVARTKWER